MIRSFDELAKLQQGDLYKTRYRSPWLQTHVRGTFRYTMHSQHRTGSSYCRRKQWQQQQWARGSKRPHDISAPYVSYLCTRSMMLLPRCLQPKHTAPVQAHAPSPHGGSQHAALHPLPGFKPAAAAAPTRAPPTSHPPLPHSLPPSLPKHTGRTVNLNHAPPAPRPLHHPRLLFLRR